MLASYLGFNYTFLYFILLLSDRLKTYTCNFIRSPRVQSHDRNKKKKKKKKLCQGVSCSDIYDHSLLKRKKKLIVFDNVGLGKYE